MPLERNAFGMSTGWLMPLNFGFFDLVGAAGALAGAGALAAIVLFLIVRVVEDGRRGGSLTEPITQGDSVHESPKVDALEARVLSALSPDHQMNFLARLRNELHDGC